MKNNLRKMMLLAAFVVLCGATAYTQVKVGGYRKIPADDAGAVAAAEFAVNAQSDEEQSEITLDAVIKAERQTVAGTNYRLCLQILAANPEEEVVEQFVQTVIFKNLKNQYSLKSWAEVEDCGK